MIHRLYCSNCRRSIDVELEDGLDEKERAKKVNQQGWFYFMKLDGAVRCPFCVSSS